MIMVFSEKQPIPNIHLWQDNNTAQIYNFLANILAPAHNKLSKYATKRGQLALNARPLFGRSGNFFYLYGQKCNILTP